MQGTFQSCSVDERDIVSVVVSTCITRTASFWFRERGVGFLWYSNAPCTGEDRIAPCSSSCLTASFAGPLPLRPLRQEVSHSTLFSAALRLVFCKAAASCNFALQSPCLVQPCLLHKQRFPACSLSPFSALYTDIPPDFRTLRGQRNSCGMNVIKLQRYAEH